MSDLKLERRSVIKFLSKGGSGPLNIPERMVVVFEKNTPSNFQVKYWCKQFRWGRESINDDPKCERPLEARTEDINKVEDLVLTDRRVKVSVIAREIGISETSAFKILYEDLEMNKESQHPSYSPDLAVCDYYLFLKHKKHLRGRRFLSNDDLEKRCDKCVSVSGSYVEK
ncbi:hypothetical protein ILUMI_15345 [Ignelater luminosus]|uniref:Mos1 transposase HTH domain-containing protein n=1 Tax=Ignelater luminosus TaxID=2038154 RepID=A0A8K0CNS2_IGNLU|nr:hypothetical protein ILUMI_15345 [Ignelater luminosus]